MRSNLFQFPEVVVVEASAGSGKTYALAKRYVQLILYLSLQKQATIESILAITFTNKATWEMKSRILDFLKRISLKQLKPFEIQDILMPLGLDEDKASQIAFNFMDQVIRNYHYFQVQTIDSFINALLSGCSFKIGLSARFKIQRNSKDYLQLALDELLGSAHQDKKLYQLFEDFIRQYLFLENRWGWFPKDDLLNVMAALFKQYNTYQKSLIVFASEEDLFAKKRKIYSLIKELQLLVPPDTNKHFLTHMQKFLAGNEGIFDVDDLKANHWTKEEFPVNKGGKVTPEMAKLWGEIQKEIHDLCWLEAHTMYNAYIRLFDVLLGQFYRIARRDDILFLEELNRKAAVLFDDELITVEELYFRLAARFRHYLIDEFQDTSLSQWRNLASMVEETLASKGSLFYVGDKKQAIYSFRGGESRLFDALQSQLTEYVQLQTLEKNFRSSPEVIAFNNCVFNVENLQNFLTRKREDDEANKREGVYFTEEDFGQIANTFGRSHQLPGKDLQGGVVRASYLSGKTKAEYTKEAKEKLIDLLNELRTRFALKDIAILTRGNQELEEITQWLLQEGIYAQSERNSDVKNNPLIQELIALLSFLQSPIDNNSFAAFCLGDLLPKASGLTHERLREFLFATARRREKEKDLYFYKAFRDEFPKEWEKFFEPFFRQVGVYPLYELTVAIIARFGCEKHFPQYQGFLVHLLQLIKVREEASCDLGAFLEYYEELEEAERFVPMAETDAVKILTVHKAKGLEFPVVIIPFLEMEIKVGSGGRDGAQAYMLDIKEEGMGLIRLKESYRNFCPDLKARYEAEYKRAFLMELNAVYVALTRAVEELYIFIPPKCGNTINNACFLLPEDCFNRGTPKARPQVHHNITPRKHISAFIDEAWLPKLREDFLNEGPVSPAAAKKGEHMHELLSQVKKPGDLPAGRQAEPGFPKEVEELINAPQLKKFFDLPAEAEVYTEQEFVNTYGDSKRIDRLVVFPKEVWVIDYKASHVGGESHQKQMAGYVELIKSFYPAKKVQGFLVYLDDLSVKTAEGGGP